MSPHQHPHGPTSPSAHPRPHRFTLCGEDGRSLSLAQGLEAFARLDGEGNQDGPALVLGLGAEAGKALAEGPLRHCRDVFWLECSAYMAGMEAQSTGWAKQIPVEWRNLDTKEPHEISPHNLAAHMTAPIATAVTAQVSAPLAARAALAAQGRRVYWHTQNLRLFPSFWGQMLGAVQATLLGLHNAQSTPRPDAEFWAKDQPRSVLLPGSETDLLHRELAEAFSAEGFEVCALEAAQHNDKGHAGLSLRHALHAHLKADRPALFFSVNGRGLDAHGVDFALLRACGVPVALWLVDNPWHILSAWRQAWWRETHIFVTDHSFIADIKKAGAASVHHLPLAAAQHMREHGRESASKSLSAPNAATDALVHFVGRASFPARDKFFAAARVPEPVMDVACARFDAVTPPDFHWWTRKLGVPLWPGYEVRTAGLGAERCASLRRARWLAAALPAGLAVYGDTQGWRALLPNAPITAFHPAVDYYGALPEVYARAPYSLNVTSLLLPAGLTQRHFDVWAAGGFLLSDSTAGLDIFPAELTQEIRLASPKDLQAAVNRLECDPPLRRHLQAAWQAHLDASHTYAHRVRRVLEIVGP